MSTNKKPSKIIQISQHSDFIRKKREEILEKQKTMQLAQSMKTNKDDTKNAFNNDGSFLENFKKITQQAKQATGSNIEGQTKTNDQTINFQQIPVAGFSGLPLNAIPVPTEIDLRAIPNPVMKVDEIKVPDSTENSNSKDQIHNVEQFIEMVAENDNYEDIFIRQTSDLHSSPLWFLLEKSSDQYENYRLKVAERRAQLDKYDPAEIYSKLDMSKEFIPKTFGSTETTTTATQGRPKTVTMARNDDSDSTNSDTEYMKEAKERNLKNLKHKALTSWKRKQEEVSSTDSDDSEDEDPQQQQRFYGKFKNSASSSAASAEKEILEQQSIEHPANRPPKRKKSRWGPSSNTSSSSGSQVKPVEPQIIQIPTQTPKLLTVTRSDPALLNYARQNYGSVNLTEDDWKKAEEHFKINLLYQDMLKKRQELDALAKSNKFKHEYDSDEDITNGTWEHKLRSQEMEATAKWAEALNKHSEGKHHIGDFLPPEELKKFMEKYSAQKMNRQPDISDYKEYKLKEDNIGFQMLQKLGWTPGAGLGAEGNGIVEPVNKAQQRDSNQGLGATSADAPDDGDNEYDAYRKRMMLAYRFRPNPLNNPRRAYY